MRGAALPAALLCAALGLMLAFAPRRVLPAAVLLLVASAVAALFVPLPPSSVEPIFLGCWASLILVALSVHVPRGVPGWLAIAEAIVAGLFAGLVIAGEGAPRDLVRALPAVLVLLPARWAVGRGWGLAAKVVSSWLIAVALLAALLPTAPTPGYVPDHMD